MRAMTLFLMSAFCLSASAATAEPAANANRATLNFAYKDAEIVKVIEDYAKATGQKFIIDPSVRGKITILNREPISLGEAFNQMSSALALNGVAISKQDDVMMVASARNVQRNLIEVGTELPPLRPEKMYTWVVQLKYADADEVNKQLRIMTSKDGEEVPVTRTNQLLITDWSSNLHRVAKVIQGVDVPVSASKAGGAKSPPRKTN